MQIGIIAALPEELDVILSSMENKKIYNKKFHKGKIGSVNIVAMLGGMGKVNAVISAQLLISNFKLDALIVTGLAGALNPEYEIGDIIIAKEAFQHDCGFLGNDGLVTHAPGTMPEISIGTGQESFIRNLYIPKDIKSIRPSFTSIEIDGQNRNPEIHIGRVATGDQFIANDKKKDELIKLGADLVEMEGSAIVELGPIFNIPIIIIRVISDKAGSEAKFDFPIFIESVSKNNAIMINHLLQSEDFLTNASKSPRVN